MSDMRMRRVTKGCGAEGSPHSPRGPWPRGLHCTHMADIQFDSEEEYAPARAPEGPKGPVELVVKWRFVKDEKQARYLFIGIIVVCVMVAIALPLLLGGSGRQKPSQLPPDATTGVMGR